MRVVVVDDHPLCREGLVFGLAHHHGIEIVGDAANVRAGLAVVTSTNADVVVVDLMMPRESGLGLVITIREQGLRSRVLGLSAMSEPAVVAEMFRAGAHGFALKSQPIGELAAAIREVHAGKRYLAPTIPIDLVDGASGIRPLEQLTKREREIFELLIRGYTTDEIASQLFISKRTVETHRQRIANKLPARTIVEMLRIAAMHGALGDIRKDRDPA